MPNNKKNRNVKNIEKNNNRLPAVSINCLTTVFSILIINPLK